MVSSLIVLAALGAARPTTSDAIPWLELVQADVKTTSASLLAEGRPEAPQVFDTYLMSDIRLAMYNEMTTFSNEMLPEGRAYDRAGSGDDVGGLALLCGLLGFFPGFGIGHLIAGNVGGFILFLCIDLVIVGVFFIVFPVFYFPFWYLASLVVILVERVVEAFSAASSATRYRGYRYADTDGAPDRGPSEHLPQAKPSFTLMNF